MVPPDSHRVSRVPWYSGTDSEPSAFRLQDCHLLWSDFPDGSTNNSVCDSAALRPDRPYNPREHAPWFGLVPIRSPLLRESRLISFPRVTEMFQFTRLASCGLCIHPRMTGMYLPGFPIRASPDQSLRAAPRCFSQLTAPFFACPCLGIPRAPLYA